MTTATLHSRATVRESLSTSSSKEMNTIACLDHLLRAYRRDIEDGRGNTFIRTLTSLSPLEQRNVRRLTENQPKLIILAKRLGITSIELMIFANVVKTQLSRINNTVRA